MENEIDSLKFFADKMELIVSYEQIGNISEAYKIADEMLNMHKDFDYAKKTKESVASMIDGVFIQIIRMYLMNKDYQKVLKIGEKFIRMRPDSDSVRSIEMFVNMAIAAIEKGK